MGTSQNLAGLRLEDHNKLKYAISLSRVGQEVMSQIFKWGYKRGRDSIKATLLALPGYNKTRFRKDFNGSQRDRLDKGDISLMDITLLYRLLQLVCGLSAQNNDTWVNPNSNSLEHCLYVIKMRRNEAAHEDLMLTPSQLKDKLDNLQMLFMDTICKACTAFNVNENDKSNFITSITEQLSAIRSSPVPLQTVTEYEKEKRINRRNCLIEDGKKEMANMCSIICQTNIVPCLTDLAVDVKDVFTEPKLKRDDTQITQRQLSSEESYVNVQELFAMKECDGILPDIIVISSINGMGRSTLLKYITEKGLNNPTHLKYIDHHDLILYQECRKLEFSSMEEFLSLLLPRTSSNFHTSDFTQALLNISFLLLLDDVDELEPNCFRILEKFIRLVSPGTRLVLTASREKAKHVQRRILALHKRVMLLELEGITESKTLKHLQKILNNIPSKIQSNTNEQKLYELLQTKYPYLQEHLRSPEVLGLIAFSWTYAPERINESTTVTEIFLLVEDLLVHKLFLSIASSSLPSMHDINSIKSNLYELLLVLSDIAVKTLSKGKFSIDDEDLQKITSKCTNLGLPKSIISTFLNYIGEHSTSPLSYSPRVSFPRRSTLQYYAAWFITQRLKEADHSASIQDFLQISKSDDDGAMTNYQDMAKYLVGMLATLIPHQLELRAIEVVKILKELRVSRATQWLQYIEEAKEHPAVTKEILRVMGDEWEVEDYAISSVLRNVLKSSPPAKLTLTVCTNPLNLPHLPEILHICKGLPRLQVSLHMYKHFWSEKTEVSDHYLKIIIENYPECEVEHFAGRLSEESILCLPTSLKKLALHLTPSMTGSLNKRLIKMSKLQMLYLNLDTSVTVDLASMTPINLPRKSIVLSLDIWKVGEYSIKWACDIAKALHNTYARLVLRHSSLDSKSCQMWLNGLHERDVNASWIVVGSTFGITEEENSQLQQCATKINCGKFVWLQI